MSWTIEIQGRTALPLRAIAWVTLWAVPADALLRELLSGFQALSNVLREGDFPGPFAPIARRHDLVSCLGAYRLVEGEVIAMSEEEFRVLAVEMDSLTAKMRAVERIDGENHAAWRHAATEVLPATGFVWLDEFLAWYRRSRPLMLPSQAQLRHWEESTRRQHDLLDSAAMLAAGPDEFERAGAPFDLDCDVPPGLHGKVWIVASESVAATGSHPPKVDRRGRPITTPAVVARLQELMRLFLMALPYVEPHKLQGDVTDLLAACRRLEEAVTGHIILFTVKEETFRNYLNEAGFQFASGPKPAGYNKKLWCQQVPRILHLVKSEIFYGEQTTTPQRTEGKRDAA